MSDSQRLWSSGCLKHKKGLDVCPCNFMLAAMHMGIQLSTPSFLSEQMMT
jgi:hypothetical protein